jgi:hypothetical protein
MEFFIESLSHLSMIKLVEELQLGMSNNMQSRVVYLFVMFPLTVFLQRGLNCKLETPVCFARPDQGYS